MLGDAFWNPTRAKNFVVAMGGKPTKWQENLAFLAAKGKMTVEQLRLLDPISYAYLVNPWHSVYPGVGAKVKAILGEDNYRNLVWYYIHQDEVAAARVRTGWRMSPTQVYWRVHEHMSSQNKMFTKQWRYAYVNMTLDASKSELKSKRPAAVAASNRLTKLPRIVG